MRNGSGCGSGFLGADFWERMQEGIFEPLIG